MDLKQRWEKAQAAMVKTNEVLSATLEDADCTDSVYDQASDAHFAAARVRSEIELEIIELAQMAGFVIGLPLWNHQGRKIAEAKKQQLAA